MVVICAIGTHMQTSEMSTTDDRMCVFVFPILPGHMHNHSLHSIRNGARRSETVPVLKMYYYARTHIILAG